MVDPEDWEVISTSLVMYGFAALLGALWGSFANVCIYRMPPSDEHPNGRSVVSPGSHCFVCGNAVRWYDNVPLLSFLWLRGQCRDCKTRFSPRYLLVEGVVALLFVAVYHYAVVISQLPTTPQQELIYAGILCAFVWVLTVITFIDLDHHLILNKVTYVAIPVFYGLGLLLPESSWRRGLIGIAVGYGVVRVIADVFRWVTKRDGMGYGDGKLLALVGALLGWQAVVVVLFLGSYLGTIIILPILIGRRIFSSCQPDNEPDTEENEEETPNWRRVELPFGPFLALGAVIYIFVEARLQVSFFFLW